MGTYVLKSIGKNTDYMTVIKETEDGYVVRIIRDQDGYKDISTDFLARSLFESCLRTGYITKIETGEERLAANA